MNTIEVRGLNKTYDRFAIKNLSLDVKKGYITGLIGPNGAGKSTLIKMLLGMTLPDSGEIRLFGQTFPAAEVQIKERIGVVFDESYFYEHLTIAEMKGVVAPFYRSWNEQKFAMYLDRFELPSKKKIKDLSKGMKTKFALALALSQEAELLIMDEPTAGLDPVFRRELLDLLADLMQDEGNTILFSTHLTTDLDRTADYIAFINRGQLVFSEAKDDVLDRYALVKGGKELLDRDVLDMFVGIRETAVGFEGLVANRGEAEALLGSHALFERPSLEDIMFFTAKGGRLHV